MSDEIEVTKVEKIEKVEKPAEKPVEKPVEKIDVNTLKSQHDSLYRKFNELLDKLAGHGIRLS